MFDHTPDRPFVLDTRDKTLPTVALFGMVLLLLITAYLGARGLDADPVWADEMITMRHAGAFRDTFSLNDVWYSVKDGSKAHSPGYFLMLGTWGHLTGWSPVTLRYLSLLLGLLGVAFTYRLGRDALSWRVGVYSAALVGTSALFTYYLHEMRMYSLLVTIAAFSLWAYFYVYTRRRTIYWYEWLVLFIAALIPMYIHYFVGLVLVVMCGYHATFAFVRLVVRPVTRNRWRWFMMGTALALGGLAFLPWARNLSSGIDAAHAASPTLAETALPPDQLLWEMISRFGNGWAFATALGLGLAALVAWRTRQTTVFIWATGVALLIGVVGVNILQEIIPARRLRYLLVLWPSLALLISIGLTGLTRRRGVSAALVLLWTVVGFNASMGHDITQDQGGAKAYFPLHKIADTIEPMITADDALLVFGKLSPQWGDALSYYLNPLTPTALYVDDDLGPTLDTIQTTVYSHNRIWVVYQTTYPTWFSKEFVSTLDERYHLSATYDCPDDLHAELYVR